MSHIVRRGVDHIVFGAVVLIRLTLIRLALTGLAATLMVVMRLAVTRLAVTGLAATMVGMSIVSVLRRCLSSHWHTLRWIFARLLEARKPRHLFASVIEDLSLTVAQQGFELAKGGPQLLVGEIYELGNLVEEFSLSFCRCPSLTLNLDEFIFFWQGGFIPDCPNPAVTCECKRAQNGA